MMSKKLRVGLIGCGQIADAHLQEIRKIDGADLVAVCDVHQDLADQAAARFDVPRAFDNQTRMLSETTPDVVHLTTPAHTHAPIAMELLRAGVHVYVEKPFTVHPHEAETVLEVARDVGCRVCLGHDQLFDPSWIRCHEMVDAGVVGDVTHVESVLGYPLSGQFGRQVTSDPNHWVRKLPGGLFQNTLSHPLYRITDFLTDDRPELDARWFSGASGVSFPTEFIAHLRGERVTGSLLFSTRIESQRITRVYGTRGALEVDLDAQVIRVIRGSRLPGAFGKLESPWRHCREAMGNLRRNIWRFLKSDIHYFAGMRSLFEQFYRSIRDGGPPPISDREMLRVTWIMDELFRQCREREGVVRSGVTKESSSGKRDAAPRSRASSSSSNSTCVVEEVCS